MSNTSKKLNRKKAIAMLGVAAALAYTAPSMLSMNSAHASGGGPGGGGMFGGMFGFGGEGGGLSGFAPRDAITKKECSDCHQAYGPNLMPQGSWQNLMGNLSNHFGEDASLDEKTRSHIEQYMVQNAARGTGPLRITEQRWFIGAHRGEVRWTKTMFKCNSCHR